MTYSKQDYINYRLQRAKETYEEATILANSDKYTGAVNRLYYACFYAIIALFYSDGIITKTHAGLRNSFSNEYIKTKKIELHFGKLYNQLFEMRNSGDYNDFYNFNKDNILPLLIPVKDFINQIELIINNTKH